MNLKAYDEVIYKITTTYNENGTFNLSIATNNDYEVEEFRNLTMETVESIINGKSKYIMVSTLEEIEC